MEQNRIKACLCHLCNPLSPLRDFDFRKKTHLVFQPDAWDEIAAMLADAGCNMIVLAIGNAIRLDCCPELAAENAWTKEEARAELARLRGMGFEVIPKLNFSTTHDEWLGVYGRMISTDVYYQVVSAVIEEVAELFDRPRLFHIGMDEEQIELQKQCDLVVLRQNELWWHDLYFLCDRVREAGCRPWMWADYLFDHEEFLTRAPKDVLMSFWYYGNFPGDTEAPQIHSPWYAEKTVNCYHLLDSHGFDQVPGTGNWDMVGNLASTVKYFRETCSREHFLGILYTVWYATERESLPRYRQAAQEMAELDW